MEFKWQHPEFLWLGPALFVVVWIASFLFHRWRKGAWQKLGILEKGNTHTFEGISMVRFFTRHTALALAAAFMGLALANLQMGSHKQLVERKGADIIFALDVSRSMLAEDIAPSRLEKAKLIISRTIDILGGDRLGIIAYAGSAYPALPITTDYAAAKTALMTAHPDAAPSQGTNLAAALEYANGYFDPESPAGRYIIILTDGEDHEGLSAAVQPEFPINTMIVGLGSTKGGPIPIRKTRSGTQYKKDEQGEVVITKRDEAKLAKLSADLGSIYVDGNYTENALDAIENLLDSSEKANIQEEITIDFNDQFQWFILPALIFLLVYLVLPSRGGPLFKTNYFTLLALAIIPATTMGQNQTEPQWTLPVDSSGQLSLPQDAGSLYQYQRAMQRGKQAFEDFDYETAASEYIGALQLQPDSIKPYLNTGNSLMKLGKVKEAQALYGTALNLQNTRQEKSDLLYNLGNTFFKTEDYEKAIAAYKKSLRINPDQTDALYNLSQAMRKLQQEQNQDQQDQDQEDQDQQDQNQDQQNGQDGQQDQQNDQDSQQDGQQDQQDQQNDQGSEQDAQDGEDNERNKPQEGGEQKTKMTPQEIKGLLEAIQREDQKTAEKVTAKQAKGSKRSGEKDW